MHPCCLNYKDKWFYSQTGLLSPAHTVKNRAIHSIPSSASHCLFHFLTHGECRTRTLTTVSKYTLIVSFSFNELKDTWVEYALLPRVSRRQFNLYTYLRICNCLGITTSYLHIKQDSPVISGLFQASLCDRGLPGKVLSLHEDRSGCSP